jgi:hypothetical protein
VAQLSLGILRKVAVGLLLLVVPGVVLTALVTGSVAALLFGLPLSSGLLIGAALSPTDPAILVPLFERLRVRPKVSQTIIAESALNDPTGAVLALAFAGVVLSGHASVTAPMVDFVKDLAISTAMGVVFGIVLSAAVSSRRAGIWRESCAIAVLAVVAGSFFSIDSAGGSGYLGAFLAGLIVGNMDRLGLAMFSHHENEMRVLISTRPTSWDLSLPRLARTFLTTIVDHRARSGARRPDPVARPLAAVCLLSDRRAAWTRWEFSSRDGKRVVPAAMPNTSACTFRTPTSS